MVFREDGGTQKRKKRLSLFGRSLTDSQDGETRNFPEFKGGYLLQHLFEKKKEGLRRPDFESNTPVSTHLNPAKKERVKKKKTLSASHKKVWKEKGGKKGSANGKVNPSH